MPVRPIDDQLNNAVPDIRTDKQPVILEGDLAERIHKHAKTGETWNDVIKRIFDAWEIAQVNRYV
jgi:hypothetical protein